MIVVDTNVIAYLLLSSDKSTVSEQALLIDPIWAAPRLWRSEMRNVLALYLRRGLLSLTDAQQVMTEATDLMRGQEYEVTSNQVLELVSASSCSAYDCEFVALARDLDAWLVTVDRQILAEFPDTAVSLQAFVEVQ